jgi:uncharacterized protein YnzC (UPF0291/DUF896 family)
LDIARVVDHDVALNMVRIVAEAPAPELVAGRIGLRPSQRNADRAAVSWSKCRGQGVRLARSQVALNAIRWYCPAMSHGSSAHPLDRILDPVGRCLTPEVARALVDLRTDPETLARIEQLADKNTEDELTPSERAEYETYVSAMDFLSVLQAKARRLLSGAAIG